ncbi:hypothetical protein LWI29_018528 [Acer saccharum]|uniref:Uncharacterized protein n=1 Tax=Acer saccharum TaxID=4024 RepID=A0AA39SBS4_ACESA|nr:hypothetical protein LWI29_018528 [Acer saccharum]
MTRTQTYFPFLFSHSLVCSSQSFLLPLAGIHSNLLLVLESTRIFNEQAQLVKRAREQIQLMEETVEEFEQSGMYPLTVSLYQMDLDMAQFPLRSYLQIRLQKPQLDTFVACKSSNRFGAEIGTEVIMNEVRKVRRQNLITLSSLSDDCSHSFLAII